MTLTKWALDATHSEINFKIKHLMISTVTGQFKKFDVVGYTDGDDFKSAKKIEFTADIDSIDTNNEQRDQHLKSADFFNSQDHPQIHFTGNKYELKGTEGILTGDISIAGITKPISLNIEFGGIVSDPYGQIKAGFTVTGKLSRKDFGITYNASLETGGVLLGDEIKINAEIQLVKQVVAENEESLVA
ncbi:MAG: YceI family protein [Ginsengibacter sp.]|jgi:polyisoprenoid-binding protein YceI